MGQPISPELLMAGSETSANMLMSHLTNVKNRKFTREMYKTQRQDALSDWAMNNEYNSPRAQMQRFQEAGLNPNLIYGQMSEASPVRSSAASGGQAEAPKGDFTKYFSLKQQSAQTDLLAKQLSIADAEVRLKDAQTLATIANTGLTETQKQNLIFDLGLKSDLRDTTIAGAEAGVSKTLADTKYTLDQNERAAVMQSKSLEEMTARILSIRAGTQLTEKQKEKLGEEITLLKKDQRIKELDATLADRGIRPGDPVMLRYIGGIIEGLYKKLFGGKDEGNNPDREPGETLEQYRKRKSIGDHK